MMALKGTHSLRVRVWLFRCSLVEVSSRRGQRVGHVLAHHFRCQAAEQVRSIDEAATHGIQKCCWGRKTQTRVNEANVTCVVECRCEICLDINTLPVHRIWWWDMI